jgi:hypothetical protein
MILSPSMKPKLTLEALKTEARTFAELESTHQEPSLYGVTDGKAVGRTETNS